MLPTLSALSAVFFSDARVPHEVLPSATRERWAASVWFHGTADAPADAAAPAEMLSFEGREHEFLLALAALEPTASDAVGEEKKEKARKDSAAFIAAAVKRAAAAAEKEAELAKREEAKKRDSSRDGGGGEKGAAAAGRRFLRGDDLKYVPPDRITMDASGAGGGIGPGVARFGGWDTASSIESSDLEDDVDFDSRTAGAGADAAIWAR